VFAAGLDAQVGVAALVEKASQCFRIAGVCAAHV
jgi:hypothetical protein